MQLKLKFNESWSSESRYLLASIVPKLSSSQCGSTVSGPPPLVVKNNIYLENIFCYLVILIKRIKNINKFIYSKY